MKYKGGCGWVTCRNCAILYEAPEHLCTLASAELLESISHRWGDDCSCLNWAWRSKGHWKPEKCSSQRQLAALCLSHWETWEAGNCACCWGRRETGASSGKLSGSTESGTLWFHSWICKYQKRFQPCPRDLWGCLLHSLCVVTSWRQRGAVPHSQKRKRRKMRRLKPQAPCSLSSLRGEAPTAR